MHGFQVRTPICHIVPVSRAYPYDKLPPVPPRKAGFRSVSAPFGSVSARFGSVWLRFGSVSGPFRVVGWGWGGVGERGFCKGKEYHKTPDPGTDFEAPGSLTISTPS